jgi:hypothetical protein
VVFGRPVNYRLLLSFSDLIQLISVRKTKTVKKNWKKKAKTKRGQQNSQTICKPGKARQDKTRQDKTRQNKT